MAAMLFYGKQLYECSEDANTYSEDSNTYSGDNHAPWLFWRNVVVVT